MLDNWPAPFPQSSPAGILLERQHLQLNETDFRGRVTFGDLPDHYLKHELDEQTESVSPKSHATIAPYTRLLRNRVLPRWGDRIALGIAPLEIENWLFGMKRDESLENPTLDRARRVMSLVYKHGQRCGLIQ